MTASSSQREGAVVHRLSTRSSTVPYVDGHAVILDPIIGLSRLEPASAAVPAAAEKQQNEDEDDEKCCLIHIGLRG